MTTQSLTENKIILLFADEDEDKKCEDKVTWCEADNVNCNRAQIKESCQKYCGLCKGMN